MARAQALIVFARMPETVALADVLADMLANTLLPNLAAPVRTRLQAMRSVGFRMCI